MTRFLPRLYPGWVYDYFCRQFLRSRRYSYAQCGEDMILDVIFLNRDNGFYVDVGANNPFEQSNTCHFYRKGWTGINIDALPNSMREFNKHRPRDINLEIPISDIEEVLIYHMYETSFYNGFSPAEPADIDHVKLIGTRSVQTQTLSRVLDGHVLGHEIDFLSVDVEGWDLRVLKSNDWSRFRPKVVVVESFAYGDSASSTTAGIGGYLDQNGYLYLCGTLVNAFYIERSFCRSRFGGCREPGP
ncbi:MAG: FkbM family methyltransferase [Phycisphaerae bacterium]|nr:FkbM family methyltransferase [Phycisphaerae bacterium]